MALIVAGGPEMFGTLAFGHRDQRTINYLENQFTHMSQYLTDAGNAFLDRSRAIFEQFNGAEALRMAKAAMRAVTHAFTPNTVVEIKTLPALQQATPVMQRWIMACPEVRTYYHQQRIDGYSDTYIDAEPDCAGLDHTDYRTVMSGVVQELPDQENGEGDWKISFYFEDSEDETPLLMTEKVDILSTWDLIRSMLKTGQEDPTSVYCGKIG